MGQHSAETQSQGPDPICFSPYLYRARNLVERFFNKIKQCRRVATRYDKLAANYLAFIKLASIRIWLRVNESTPWLDAACCAGSAIFVANAARRVHPMGTRSTVAHNPRWAQELDATMVAAGATKRHSHRTKIQSDFVASIPTSSPRSRQRRFELSTAVSANAQRRHEPRQRLMKRSRP